MPIARLRGQLNSQCPIFQAKKKAATKKTTSEFTISQITEHYGIYRQLLANWIFQGKIPSEKINRGSNNTCLIPKNLLPRIEQLVTAYKQYGHTRGV